MDSELGAEVTCLDATDHGAEVLGLKTISVTVTQFLKPKSTQKEKKIT
jgi:hypothetical protein